MDLKIFADTNLFEAGTSFFKHLNIRLNSSSTSSLPLKSILKNKFKSQEIFEKDSIHRSLNCKTKGNPSVPHKE
jgi:hypothetical protein